MRGKNIQLQKERGPSFEAVVVAIEEGKLIDIIANTSSNHLHQKVLVVDIEAYLVLVSFVEDEEKIFLKTALCLKWHVLIFCSKKGDDTSG